MLPPAATRDSDLAEANLWEAVPNWPLATGNSPLDITRWLYDDATGLLTNKLYADGLGTAYTYTPDGQLASRIWARDITTTYNYTNVSSLASITYSDSTPDISFTYDRLGRMTTATQSGTGGSPVIHSYTYDGLDLVSETQNGVEITRTTDPLGRPSGFSLSPLPLGEGQGEGTLPYSVAYAYDSRGRFHSITGHWPLVTGHYTYSYLINTDLLSGMTASSGHAWTRAYEAARPLITSVQNTYYSTVISQFAYANDALGRRTSRADSGLAFANPAFDAYSYNTRSEVTSARCTPVGSATELRGLSYDYEYNASGNLTLDRRLEYTWDSHDIVIEVP